MENKKYLPGLLIAAAVLLWCLTPVGEVASQTIRQVFVTNFPAVQTVDGRVEVEGPVLLSEVVTFESVIVPPVGPSETTRLVSAGSLVTDGFPNVVLSLHGVVKGDVKQEGEVGAILLPEVDVIREAFDEQGLVHFAMRVSASGVSSRTPYFASAQPRHRVGFPSYEVFLYNTTDKTVTVDLFAYLTN